MEYSLITIKNHLYREITNDINSIFTTVSNEITYMLTSKWIITKQYVVKKIKPIEKSFEDKIQKNADKWIDFIEEEIVKNQIADNTTYTGLECILTEERNYYKLHMDEIKLAINEERRQAEVWKYALTFMIIPPSRLDGFLDICSFYLKPQLRGSKTKSALEDEKHFLLSVIEKRMDKLFEKIQNLCNNDV